MASAAAAAAAVASQRIIPSPVQQNSFPSHTSNHISISAAAHQQQQSHKSQSSTHSPPTVIKQMNRNDVMVSGLHAAHSDVRQVAPEGSAPRSARPALNGRGEFSMFNPSSSDRTHSSPVTFILRTRRINSNNSLPFCKKKADVGSDVKRQPAAEVLKAHAASESETGELVTVERMRMERLICEVRRQAAEEAVLSLSKQEDSSESCWNCGRKAAETCSGCNVARYCGSFCQHKDWENHHRVCGQGISLSASSSANLNTSSESATSSPCNGMNGGVSNSSTSTPVGNPVSVASVVAAAAAAAVVASAAAGSGTAAAEAHRSTRIRGSPSPPVNSSRQQHPVRICINDKN